MSEELVVEQCSPTMAGLKPIQLPSGGYPHAVAEYPPTEPTAGALWYPAGTGKKPG